MERVFCGTPGRPGPLGKPGYRVINFVDKGWIKFRWDRRRGLSFTQWADLKQNTHPYFHYFLPSGAGDPVLDANLQPAGIPAFGLNNLSIIPTFNITKYNCHLQSNILLNLSDIIEIRAHTLSNMTELHFTLSDWWWWTINTGWEARWSAWRRTHLTGHLWTLVARKVRKGWSTLIFIWKKILWTLVVSETFFKYQLVSKSKT